MYYITESFENFQEVYKLINYEPAQVATEWWNQQEVEVAQTVEDPFEEQYAENVDWQETVTEIMVNAMAKAHPSTNERDLEKLREKIINNGEVSWQAVAGFWSKMGTGYAQSWRS